MVIEADRIQASAEGLSGEGDVSLRLGPRTVVAERFHFDRAESRLELENGWFETDEGQLSFQTATLSMPATTAALARARYTSDTHQLVITAEGLEIRDDGHWTGADVWLSTCGCDAPLWSVSARTVEITVDRAAVVTGGWLAVCERPVLPVPRAVVPLVDRKAGLLAPGAGWNDDGLRATAPVFVPLGRSSDLLLTPEWRGARGGRGLVSLDAALAPGEALALSGAAGWDALSSQWRGAGRWQHAWDPGRLRTAADLHWMSDEAYLADYGGSYLGRSQPWSERRAVVGWGLARLETDTFDLVGAEQRPASVVLTAPPTPLGPVALAAAGRLDTFGAADGSLTGTAERARVSSLVSASSGAETDFFIARGRVAGLAERWLDGPQALGSVVDTEVALPLWGRVGAATHLAELGARGAVSAEAIDSEELSVASWAVGPQLRSRWLGAAVPARAEIWAPWTDDGLAPVGVVDARWRDLQLSLTGDSELVGGRLGWTAPAASAAIRGVHTDELLQAGASVGVQLPGRLQEWRPSGDLLLDLRNDPALSRDAVLSRGAGLLYDSRCDCLQIKAAVAWAADRTWPDAALEIALQ